MPPGAPPCNPYRPLESSLPMGQLVLNCCEQAKALSELFKSMSVLGKWPENRLFSNIAHPLTSGRMPTIWQLALISFVDECIGDFATSENVPHFSNEPAPENG